MNLIVDETPSDVSSESGNNVGKTTVLRLVNYCFGADGKKIYSDPEFADKQDPAVRPFLEDNNVIIEIRIAKDLHLDEESDIVIERNFLKRGSKAGAKIQRLNGTDYSDSEFARALKEALFNSSVSKPTVKQIVAKNIREGSIRTENALRVLDPYTKPVEYEALFLFLLGIPVEGMPEKQQLEDQARIETTLIRRLNKDASESEIDQALLVIERRINDLEQQRNSLNVNPEYQKDLAALDSARRRIVQLSTQLGAMELRQQLLTDSINEIGKEHSDVSAEVVEQLYREANTLIPGLQRTFAETLAFHNRMIAERVAFLRRELPDLVAAITQMQTALGHEKSEESRLASRVAISDSYDMIEKISGSLFEAYRQKGQYEESRKIRHHAQTALDKVNSELRLINDGIDANKKLVEQRIAEFNEIFARLSFGVYGESFILSSNWTKGTLNLGISSVGDNPGTGKKLGQIAIFDLSYIIFADSQEIPCFHFVMQDRMENVHGNQLRTLGEIIKESNCQYIVTILRDKLPTQVLADSTVILTLSQHEKLFKLM